MLMAPPRRHPSGRQTALFNIREDVPQPLATRLMNHPVDVHTTAYEHYVHSSDTTISPCCRLRRRSSSSRPSTSLLATDATDAATDDVHRTPDMMFGLSADRHD
jgi:hypothetical protein